MWHLASRSPGLDLNSAYTYLILCRHFSRTCLVAQAPQGLAGFVTGYLLPDRTDTLFLWQIAVAPTHRRTGLGRRLIGSLLADLVPLGIRYLHATVTPGNDASLALFSSVARDNGVECLQSPFFSAEMFPAEDDPSSPHQPELLLQLGPFGRSGTKNGDGNKRRLHHAGDQRTRK
ncbi:diaminobutyrate acetyltransferase [soil metagenome]